MSTYTLTMRGLSFEKAKEIANSDCELMWANEGGISTAYPTTDEHPTTIELDEAN